MSDASSMSSVSFDCPNYIQATRLADALEVWGAESVTTIGRKVAVECDGALLMALMGLFNNGIIEQLQEGKLTAEEIGHRYLRSVVDPGEVRG